MDEFPRLFEEGRLNYEYRFLKKDGSYCWVNDEQRLMRDEAGQPIEIVGSWSDISARKQAAKPLARRRIASSTCSPPPLR